MAQMYGTHPVYADFLRPDIPFISTGLTSSVLVHPVYPFCQILSILACPYTVLIPSRADRNHPYYSPGSPSNPPTASSMKHVVILLFFLPSLAAAQSSVDRTTGHRDLSRRLEFSQPIVVRRVGSLQSLGGMHSVNSSRCAWSVGYAYSIYEDVASFSLTTGRIHLLFAA